MAFGSVTEITSCSRFSKLLVPRYWSVEGFADTSSRSICGMRRASWLRSIDGNFMGTAYTDFVPKSAVMRRVSVNMNLRQRVVPSPRSVFNS